MLIRIVQCPKCGEIQGTLAQKVFQCKVCNATRHLRKIKVLKKTSNSEEARVLIAALKVKPKKISSKQKELW